MFPIKTVRDHAQAFAEELAGSEEVLAEFRALRGPEQAALFVGVSKEERTAEIKKIIDEALAKLEKQSDVSKGLNIKMLARKCGSDVYYTEYTEEWASLNTDCRLILCSMSNPLMTKTQAIFDQVMNPPAAAPAACAAPVSSTISPEILDLLDRTLSSMEGRLPVGKEEIRAFIVKEVLEEFNVTNQLPDPVRIENYLYTLMPRVSSSESLPPIYPLVVTIYRKMVELSSSQVLAPVAAAAACAAPVSSTISPEILDLLDRTLSSMEGHLTVGKEEIRAFILEKVLEEFKVTNQLPQLIEVTDYIQSLIPKRRFGETPNPIYQEVLDVHLSMLRASSSQGLAPAAVSAACAAPVSSTISPEILDLLDRTLSSMEGRLPVGKEEIRAFIVEKVLEEFKVTNQLPDVVAIQSYLYSLMPMSSFGQTLPPIYSAAQMVYREMMELGHSQALAHAAATKLQDRFSSAFKARIGSASPKTAELVESELARLLKERGGVLPSVSEFVDCLVSNIKNKDKNPAFVREQIAGDKDPQKKIGDLNLLGWHAVQVYKTLLTPQSSVAAAAAAGPVVPPSESKGTLRGFGEGVKSLFRWGK